MSRIGKAPITLPAGVEASINGRELTVKGAKGSLSWTVSTDIKTEIADNTITFTPVSTHSRHSAIWGTTRALVANMVLGVSEGFSVKLKMVGVGYRSNMQGNKLNLTVGFSHPVLMDVPEGLQVKVEGNTEIEISGIDKQSVGAFAAVVRDIRPPEPFKGKGIRYANEHINMKEGKKK